MDRIIIGLCCVLSVAIVGFMVWNASSDPYAERQAQLEADIENISPAYVDYQTRSDIDFEQIWDTVLGKPKLWRELIPPPPPPPKPEPKPKPPDFNKLLNGVTATKLSMGTGDEIKVMVKHPGNKRGEFLGIGDKVGGVTIKSITADQVVWEAPNDGRKWTRATSRK